MTTSSSEVHCPICFEPFPFSHFDAHAATHKVLSSNIFEKTRKLLGKSNFTQNELNLNENLIISGLDDRDYDAFMNLTVEEREEDMTAWITKRHFVESTVCIECRLALGLVNGNNNCAKCGKGYCTNHCRYQMKLSIDARHDPVNGIWAFCCKSCYQSRKGYQYSLGVTRRKTIGFQLLRTEKLEDLEKEVNKIQKRLRVLLDSQNEDSKPGIIAPVINSLTGSELPIINSVFGTEKIDQIVPWQDGQNCSTCSSPFTLILRKHHCRLSGHIICHPCSTFLDNIRICKPCIYLISLYKPEPEISEMQKAYDMYGRYKNAITNLQPSYAHLISRIKEKELIDYKDLEYQSALKIRKEVLDMGVLIENLAKKVKNMDGRVGFGVYLGMIGFVRETVGRMELLPMKKVEGYKTVNPQKAALEESRAMLRAMMEEAMGKRKLEDAEAIKNQLREVETELQETDFS